ncbi:MAG TPA: carboxymuconolactone decarboxylase family protein [Methylophilaceae bacterium]|nr:carboxymuconolactone decarboxylase family protein [Methylophilaceae bacterium]
MARISTVSRNQVSAEVNATLDAVKAKIGAVPNLFATFAQAPAVLNGYLAFSDALTRGRLSPAQRESLALAIGQANSCQYCLSAHTLLAKGAGLNPAAISAARTGNSADDLTDGLLKLAVKIVKQRGVLSDADIEEARESGVDDSLIVEVIANVALNTLTNYTNHIAATDIDFPVVQL